MRTYRSTLLIAVFSLLLSACGSGSGKPIGPSASSESASKAAVSVKILASPSATAVVGQSAPASAPRNIPWSSSGGRETFALIEDTVFQWDRNIMSELGGVVERSALTGQLRRARAVENLNINGVPQVWLPIPGGYLARWNDLCSIKEVNGALRVGWKLPGRWWDAFEVVDDALLAVSYRPKSELLFMSLDDAEVRWRTALPRAVQSVEMSSDKKHIYLRWTEYSPTAPTPKVVIPMRVRAFERATGKALWTVDFSEHPGALAASEGTVVAALAADLHFIDGASRRTIKVATGYHPNIYPTFKVVGDRLYVALEDAVVAYNLADAAELWRAPVVLNGGPKLTAEGDMLYVSTAHHSILALKQHDGKRVWEIGVGLTGHRFLSSEQALLMTTGRSSAGMTRTPVVVAETAVISGRVTKVLCKGFGEVMVRIGDQRVKPKPSGEFSATVTAAGIVAVSTVGNSMLGSDEGISAATVKLNGSKRYRVPDLTASFCDRG